MNLPYIPLKDYLLKFIKLYIEIFLLYYILLIGRAKRCGMEKETIINKFGEEKLRKNKDKDYKRFYDVVLRKGEIRKYAKNTNIFGDYNVGYCLILNDSFQLNPRVLVCPLYSKEQIDNKQNLKLVKFKMQENGVDKDVYGSLLDIRFINKRKFVEFGEGTNEVIDEIAIEVVYKILEIYMLLLTQLIIKCKKEQPIPC